MYIALAMLSYRTLCRFDNLNTLAVLGLRGNGITLPPKDAIASLQSIQELRLDQNNITIIGKDAFGSMRVVSTIGLSENQVKNKVLHQVLINRML